jgi:hypothetical protein
MDCFRALSFGNNRNLNTYPRDERAFPGPMKQKDHRVSVPNELFDNDISHGEVDFPTLPERLFSWFSTEWIYVHLNEFESINVSKLKQ